MKHLSVYCSFCAVVFKLILYTAGDRPASNEFMTTCRYLLTNKQIHLNETFVLETKPSYPSTKKN